MLRMLARTSSIAILSLTLACDGDDDGAEDEAASGGDDSAEQLCVDTINDYRATLDLPPLERWMDAEDCSSQEAKSDSESGTAHGAFGQCGEFAQNECPGWPGPTEQLTVDCLALMWAEGPGEPFSEHGHYINMSNPDYTQVACGFYETPGGDWWAVQNFK